MPITSRCRLRLSSLLLLFAGLLALTPRVNAADLCQRIAPAVNDGSLAARVAAIACRENALWYTPFIDADGRLVDITVVEAETMRLADGATPAWLRVAEYWRDSGLLGRMAAFPGATSCAYARPGAAPPLGCRTFVIDQPWSAAFVSWVMEQAGVPGFLSSPSHIDYVRAAYLQPDASPYRFADPEHAAPAAGDLLCFARNAPGIAGFEGLRAYIAANPAGGLGMHCDVVVAASPGGDGRLYAVGGNVEQGVTLRILHLNRNGLLWNLPRGSRAGCSPDAQALCSFSRQNWVALLKLKPLQPLRRVPQPVSPLSPEPMQQCCVNCVLGSGVPRCPNPPVR